MLNELGKIALERDLLTVHATVVATKKNQPARDFLEKVATSFCEEIEKGTRYLIPAAIAAESVFSFPSSQLETEPQEDSRNASPSLATRTGVLQRFERIATDMCSPEHVLAALQARSKRRRSRPKCTAPTSHRKPRLSRCWLNSMAICCDLSR